MTSEDLKNGISILGYYIIYWTGERAPKCSDFPFSLKQWRDAVNAAYLGKRLLDFDGSRIQSIADFNDLVGDTGIDTVSTIEEAHYVFYRWSLDETKSFYTEGFKFLMK